MALQSYRSYRLLTALTSKKNEIFYKMSQGGREGEREGERERCMHGGREGRRARRSALARAKGV
jgi:hypothetical protein